MLESGDFSPIAIPLLVGGVLLLLVALLVLGWWKRSTIAAAFALAFVLFIGLILQPWTVFAPPPTDPYEADALVWVRVASVVWALFVIASLACLATVISRRRLVPHDTNAA